MNRKIINKIFWNQAGFSGLIIGGILSVANIFAYLMRDASDKGALVSNLLLLCAFIVVPYILGKRFSLKNALWGLTFQRALAYMLVMYLLAGFIYGVSIFVLFNIDMEYYLAAAEKLVADGVFDPNTLSSESLRDATSSPLTVAFISMMTMPFLSFIPALIISVFIKRNPAIRG